MSGDNQVNLYATKVLLKKRTLFLIVVPAFLKKKLNPQRFEDSHFSNK
jgi:hypothetical protein